MTTGKAFWLALALAFGVIVGCSPSSSPKGKVVATVNGHELTETELNARAKNIVALHRHRQGTRAVEQKLAKLEAMFKRGYAKVWAEDRVLEDYAKQKGVATPTEEIDQCHSAALRNFKGPGDRTYADLLATEGLDRRLWEDQVCAEARRHRLEKYWAEQYPTNLPPTYADDVIRQMNEWNARMTLTNAEVYARATNVWEKLKAGADFVKTAKEHTELKSEIIDDCEWGVIDDKFLSDEPELQRAVKNMKEGEFSAPIAADGGLLIVRLNRREKQDGDDVYTLARIFFRLPRFLTPAPKEEIVHAAYDRYAKRLFKEKLAELVDAAKPTFNSEFTKETKTKETATRKGGNR